MEQNVLSGLVDQGLSQRQIADTLHASQTAVRYWLGKFKLKTKRPQWNVKTEFRCRYCGEREASKFAKRNGKLCHTICLGCDNHRSVERFRSSKAKAVKFKGGKCEKCGYDKCMGALQFHHPDPKTKDPNFHKMKCWSFDKVEKELEKCQLLCANCHAELHWG